MRTDRHGDRNTSPSPYITGVKVMTDTLLFTCYTTCYVTS